MMKKDQTQSSLSSALEQVRRSIASMTDERAKLQRRCDALGEELRACINAPLSKAAMIELQPDGGQKGSGLCKAFQASYWASMHDG